MVKEYTEDERNLAACFYRVFLGDEDGRRVLEHLRRRFPSDALRFDPAKPNAVSAALIEGKASVMKEIETALKVALPISQ